jgi:hypothetical protein
VERWAASFPAVSLLANICDVTSLLPSNRAGPSGQTLAGLACRTHSIARPMRPSIRLMLLDAPASMYSRMVVNKRLPSNLLKQHALQVSITLGVSCPLPRRRMSALLPCPAPFLLRKPNACTYRQPCVGMSRCQAPLRIPFSEHAGLDRCILRVLYMSIRDWPTGSGRKQIARS